MSIYILLITNYCEHCHRGDAVYDTQFTYNFREMAEKAGIYEPCFNPDKYTKAGDMVRELTNAILKLNTDPSYFKKFNAPNGWGTYEQFIRIVRDYRDMCEKYPDASISCHK